MNYVIITPVHNEEAYIRHTLEAVSAQTIKPTQWIIVNDGSTDNTPKIVQEYLDQYSWIKLVDLPVEGKRELGARVVRVFYEGYKHIAVEYDFIIKMDGDLSFAPDYFELLFEKFNEDPCLGIAGGVLYIPAGNRWQLEKVPADHVRGPTKVYRKLCFLEIGGLPETSGWDAIDEWRAQMKGWKTRSFNDLVVHHFRPTGASYGKWGRYILEGEHAFFLKYPLPIVIARSLYRGLTDRPFLMRGLGYFWGYLGSWWAHKPQLDDTEVTTYMRKKLYRRLLFFRPSKPL